MSIRTRKIFLIVDKDTYRILHTTTDKWLSMQEFNKLAKTRNVIAQCIYQ